MPANEAFSGSAEAAELKPGDGIQVYTDDGFIVGVKRIFGVEDDYIDTSIILPKKPNELPTEKLYVLHGNVEQKVDNIIKVRYDSEQTSCVFETPYRLEKTVIYVYENGTVRMGNSGDIFSAESTATGSEVYLYTHEGTFRSMLVVKD